MRIDIVTDTFAPDINGVAMTLGRWTTGLRALGHRVHVIHTGETAGKGETCVSSVPLPGYREVRVGLPAGHMLRGRWMRKRPDSVYVATESPLGKSAVNAARALGIGVVTGFHTNFHEYADQYKLGIFQPAALSWLRAFHRKAGRTLAPSADVVARLNGEGFTNLHLLGRGVDTGLFHPAKRCEKLRAAWGAGDHTKVAIAVGRVAAEKNLETAVAGYERMLANDPATRFVIVGDGPLRERLERRCPAIIFAGVQSGEDLARHYASADVLLFPSETETFGNVILEGLASGLICICYDYAAGADHIRHGENGLKAPKGNGEKFLELCENALAIPHAAPLRISARATTLAVSWETIVRQFESHLQSVSPMIHNMKPTERAKRPKFSCRSVFLSDLHLGSPDSKADEIVEFLKHIRCQRLVLNGDIVDGWALKRGARWTSRHSRVVRRIIKITEHDETEVIYLRGNHDEVLDRFLPLAFGKIRFLKELIHRAADGKRYFVVHGDGFDSVSTNHRWLAVAGSVGYDFLLTINRFYNKWRAWRGKEYFSLSKRVKAKVKSAVAFVDRYEELLQNLAQKRDCDGIICGHIHTPEDKLVGNIRYLNSGDWVESLTAIIEHHNGRMELVEYRSFLEKLTGAPLAIPFPPRQSAEIAS